MSKSFLATTKTRFINTLSRLLPRESWADRFVLRTLYLLSQRRWPRRSGPAAFSERLLRHLLFDENLGLREQVSDKLEVKSYVTNIIGADHVVPTLMVIDEAADVDVASFPASCVIKPTHLSGEIIIRRNGEAVDTRIVAAWFSMNQYDITRERNYRRLVPRVVIEPILKPLDPSLGELRDYKVFCFSGRPRLIQVDQHRHTAHRRTFYTPEWRLVPMALGVPKGTPEAAPSELAQLLHLAARLSGGFSFVRVDMYLTDGGIKVGELTNYPGSCIERFDPYDADLELGRLFDSPDSELEL